jgi:putative aminopeptidase FrvX
MNDFLSPDELLADLVKIPGPPGQEDAVRDYLAEQLTRLEIPFHVDAKGNLLASTGTTLPDAPHAVVTAHMDEIAAMVTGYDNGGELRVAPLGGLYPWKWGEGPVEVLPLDGADPVTGILSFGSIHTTAPYSPAQLARDGKALTWDNAAVWTGFSRSELIDRGVVPGSRVVMSRERRTVQTLGGDRVGSYFLDDRADCVSWLLALHA